MRQRAFTFTEVSACRRHVQHQSCEAIVNNYGAADAIAGLMQRARAIAEQQAPHSSLQVEASSLRCLLQQQPRPAGQAADPSNANAYEGGHDRGSLELHTFLLNSESVLGKQLLTAMEKWKSQVPESGPRPLGARRWTVAGTVLLQDTEHADKLGKLKAFHDSLALPDMEQSVQLAVAKETLGCKDNRSGMKLLWFSVKLCQALLHEAHLIRQSISK